MKREIAIVLIGIFLFQTIGFVYASDVGYILKNTHRVNQEVMGVFSDLNLSVEFIKDKNVRNTNLSKYRLIFVGDERLRNTARYVKLYDYPSVIMNGYYGKEWGLTDYDGISQLSSTAPLRVKLVNDGIKQVYTSARDKKHRHYLAYYFLDDENKANLTSIARTYTGEDYDFGDVVAVAQPGTHLINGKSSKAKLCFYGISKTKYWTNNARELFEDCVGSVLIECYKNSDCDDNDDYTYDYCENPGTVNSQCKHKDITCLSDSDCGSDSYTDNYCLGNNVYKNLSSHICINAGDVDSYCSVEVTPKNTENCSDLCYQGKCYDVECYHDSDCGDDSNYLFCDGNNGKEVWENSYNYTCLNPGTINASCNLKFNSNLIEECSGQCYGGSCVDCLNDSDCDDGLYCNGKETCNNHKCYQGNTIDCSSFNIPNISRCDYNPDNNPFTLDVFNGFTSYCDENTDSCVVLNNWEDNISHSCSLSCGAECISNYDCPKTECDNLDGCKGNDYYDYSDVNNNCLGNCSCETNPCSEFSISYNDSRCVECSKDSDCGNESYSNNYCLNNDVYRTHFFSNCEDWSCVEHNESELVENCDFGCENGMCLIGKHDVGLIDFTNSIKGIRLEYTNGSDILGNELLCNQKYKISIKIKNFGDFIENVSFNGSVGSLFFNHNPKNNLGIGDSLIKTKTVNFSLNPGNYNINVQANIFNDDNLTNNLVSRQIEIVCPECYKDSDCDDNDDYTYDYCENPGTVKSQCKHKDITCLSDSDCGSDGFVGNLFCQNNDIYQNYNDYTCVNPGKTNSNCILNVSSMFKEDCGVDSCDNFGNNYCKNGNVYHSRTCYNRGCSAGDCYENNYNDEVLVETCNNNCLNGECVECTPGKTKQCGLTNVGECSYGIQTCSQEGSWGDCVGAVNPTNEICDGKDNDCDGKVDEGLSKSCGSGDCSGTQTCNNGHWGICSSSGKDAGICAKCDSNGNVIYDPSQNSDCDDGLYCNGVEKCNGINSCSSGTPVDCSSNDISSISSCNYNPDNNPFTLDSFSGFKSVCDENTDSCTKMTNWLDFLTHTCSYQCGAECKKNSDCNTNFCSKTYNDYCSGKRLVEYDTDKKKDSTTISDSCNNYCNDCQCSDCNVDCSAPSKHSYCVKGVCGANCVSNSDCSKTECDNLDGCYNHIYRDYHDVNNNCVDCSCEKKPCSSYTAEKDKDGDGYSPRCGDCNDNDKNIHINAKEICDGKDNDCDGKVDEGGVCIPQCSDKKDNDGDGLIDYPADPQCSNRADNDESK